MMSPKHFDTGARGLFRIVGALALGYALCYGTFKLAEWWVTR
jgi:hypothetical protein